MYALLGVFVFVLVSGQTRGLNPTESTTIEPRIIGGDKAEHGALPYQVSLQFASNNFHYCGGAIISDRFVISAAHCFPYFDAEDIQVWVGGRNLSNLEEGILVDVEEIFLHDYDEVNSRENDIAVLKLKEKLNFTDTVQSVPLNRDDVKIGTECIVSGWGVTQDDPNQMYNEHLMFANVFLLDGKTCKENYAKLKKPVNITESMICAGHINGTKDSCRGDSGGPLICDGKLVGITSFGAGCGLRNYPGVYTDVKFFLDWIEWIFLGSGAITNRFFYINVMFTLILIVKNVL